MGLLIPSKEDGFRIMKPIDGPMVSTDRPRIVIIGAGFGGLWAARALAHAPADIVVIDRNNYHTFFPLLYQVGAAELEPEGIAYPVRNIFRKLPNVLFCLADVNQVDLAAKTIEAEERKIRYDYLILALGSTSQFFNILGAAEHTFSLKTLEEGVTLRNHVLHCFERATREDDSQHRQRLLTFTIIGGGPTGVEFAGALTELVRGPLKKDYPTLDLSQVRILLIEATDHLLLGQPQDLGDYAFRRLQEMGVQIQLHSRVSQVTPESVHLKDDTPISTETAIWTAGVGGDGAVQNWGLPLTPNNQVTVRPTLQVPNYPEVYVIGDLAHVEQDGRPLPMIAPVAIQEGVTASGNILRQMKGQSALPFHYHDRGTLITIGRNAAAAHIWGQAFTGFVAWVIWLSVHIFNLIGFRNRLIVLINWAWDYFFFERGVRLIFPSKAKGVTTKK